MEPEGYKVKRPKEPSVAQLEVGAGNDLPLIFAVYRDCPQWKGGDFSWCKVTTFLNIFGHVIIKHRHSRNVTCHHKADNVCFFTVFF